jgi:aspartate/methionine/tyrosine aminotransferase
VVQYPLVYDGAWEIDFDALRHAITPRTRAIVVVNPNNPTGSFLKQEEHGELIRICRDHGLAIVSDEVFSDYARHDDPRRVRTLSSTSEVLTLSLSGLSKVAGLPQIKLGWMVVNGSDSLRQEAFERLEFIADTYLSVSTPVQWAAAGLLALRPGIQSQIETRVRRNLAVLCKAFGTESSNRLLNVEGGWYAIVQVPRVHTEEEWVLTLLDNHGVLVQPGFFFDFENEAFLVVSLLTREEVFTDGIGRWATLNER